MAIVNTENDKLILTFGYGNRSSYDDLFSYLEKFKVVCVIDVRLKPYAWTRKWYGEQIKQACNAKNINYISRPSLGNISGKSNWIPPNNQEAQETLLEISKIAKTGTVLLLCAELNSSQCHRSDVACELQKLLSTPIEHLK
jgi:uncharacterized protein (DUF488 family)